MQLRISFWFALVGIIVENLLYFRDYWHPSSVFGITIGPWVVYPEFLLFGAAFAGIATVIYPAVFRYGFEKPARDNEGLRAFIAIFLFASVSASLYLSGMNSIYATAAGASMLSLGIIVMRHDLMVPMLLSGMLTAAVQSVLYTLVFASITNWEAVLESVWYLYGTSLDVRIGLVPLTEIVWGFATGAAVGIIYPYVRGARFVRIQSNHLRTGADGDVS